MLQETGDANLAHDVYERHAKIGYFDAVAIAHALAHDHPLLTFDGDQRRAHAAARRA